MFQTLGETLLLPKNQKPSQQANEDPLTRLDASDCWLYCREPSWIGRVQVPVRTVELHVQVKHQEAVRECERRNKSKANELRDGRKEEVRQL